MSFRDHLEIRDEALTLEEYAAEAEFERNWLAHLDPERARVAQHFLAQGLRGQLQIHNGYEFEWLEGSLIHAESERCKSFVEAFDVATRRIPARFR